MTVPESRTAPVTYGSDRLARLIATIGEGALERERTGERPFAAIDLVRNEGLGALRIPSEDGGGGASLRELDSLATGNADRSTQYDQTISRLTDLDYNQALSDFARQQLSLEAAQKSFLKITSLSLFPFHITLAPGCFSSSVSINGPS